MNRQCILLIDDNQAYCEQIQKTLTLRGFKLKYFTDGNSGIKHALTEDWGVILLDVFLNQNVNGLQILKQVVETKPHVPVVMVSGTSTLQTAVEATKIGAYDFLEKPLDIERLLITIKRALELNKLSRFSQNLSDTVNKQFQLIGTSAAIRKIYSVIEQISNSDSKVLIEGESGVGKGVVARNIHFNSQRESLPFTTINCAAIPGELVESELFGYEKGAFTGAVQRKEGLIAQAEGGTLFLDEITEMPVSSQAKLLKFLNDGQYSRVGGTDVIQTDVRIISATNRNIQAEILSGRFRQDLYYRLNVVDIHIPPLRERVEDIPLLADFFRQRICNKSGKTITHFSKEAMDLICQTNWPGNARQLKSAVYRMTIFSRTNVIDYGTAATAIQIDRTNETVISGDSYEAALAEFEKLYFFSKLHAHNWNLDTVASDSNLSPETLREKLDKLHIDITSNANSYSEI